MNCSREETLFLLALEQPESERAIFLEGACQGDAALRQQVEALLGAHDETANPLSTQAESARPRMRLDLGDALDEEVGQRLGRYQLLERIGEGGCGVVYVAEQIEPVRRQVALKVIKLGMDTKQVVARFEAERQALAMMDHPNIAKVLDAGTTEQGRPYFVMELVRGIRITDYCDQASLTTKERLDLFIKVCQAIQHAHQKGIIHRDIKPSNILVTLHDPAAAGVPKVIDFGIAKATEGRLTDATVYTQLHQFIGTPAYMSPEQAEMSGLDIDTRSDIYSLGVLLYELLSGSTPFDAKELMAAGIDAMRKTIREKEPVRPSTRLATLDADRLTTTAKSRSVDTSKLRHQLQGDLDWIVMKCLEKDRTRRYDTANGLASDLRRHLENEPVLARPPSAAYKFQKAWRRNKLVFAAGTLVFVTLALGITLSTWQAFRAKQAEVLAERRLAESQAITKFLAGVFQSSNPKNEGRSATVLESLDAAVARLDTDLGEQPALRAALEATLGETFFELGYSGKAAQLQTKVVNYRRGALGLEHPDTLTAMAALAFSCFYAQLPDESCRLREEVLAARRKVAGATHPSTVAAMRALETSYRQVGRRGDEFRLKMDRLAVCRKVFGTTNVNTLLVLSDLAGDHFSMGRYEESIALLKEILEADPRDDADLQTLFRLATSQLWSGRMSEYEATCNHYMDVMATHPLSYKRELASKVPSLHQSHDAAQLARARNLAQQAFDLSPDQNSKKWARLALGMAAYRQGDFVSADREFTALDPQTEDFEERYRTAGLFHAMSLLRQGHRPEAQTLFNQIEKEMPRLSDDPANPFNDGKDFDQRRIVPWLAYKEAKEMLDAPVMKP